MSRVSFHSLPNTCMMHLPLRNSAGHGHQYHYSRSHVRVAVQQTRRFHRVFITMVRMSRQWSRVRKSVPPIPSLQRAIASQAEAKIERRVKVIQAEGEFEASRCRRCDWPKPGGLAAPLPANLGRDRVRKELDHHLPNPHRHHCPFLKGGKRTRGRSPDAETNGFEERKKQRAQ